MMDGVTALQIDLVEDLRAELCFALTRWGIKIPLSARSDPDAMSVLYFNVVQRRPEPKSRETRWSHQLKARMPVLPSDICAAVQRIARESECGYDLTQYLSRKVREAHFDDLLMNDWGMNHLHLGAPQPNAFAGRRAELLFVFPTDTILYLVDILDHQAFSDSHLIEVMHLNWPELMSRFRLSGARDLQPKLTSVERAQARQAGLRNVSTRMRQLVVQFIVDSRRSLAALALAG